MNFLLIILQASGFRGISGSLYTLKNDRRVIENKRKQLDNNRMCFFFNTRLEMTQQDQSIRSLESADAG